MQAPRGAGLTEQLGYKLIRTHGGLFGAEASDSLLLRKYYIISIYGAEEISVAIDQFQVTNAFELKHITKYHSNLKKKQLFKG